MPTVTERDTTDTATPGTIGCDTDDSSVTPQHCVTDTLTSGTSYDTSLVSTATEGHISGRMAPAVRGFEGSDSSVVFCMRERDTVMVTPASGGCDSDDTSVTPVVTERNIYCRATPAVGGFDSADTSATPDSTERDAMTPGTRDCDSSVTPGATECDVAGTGTPDMGESDAVPANSADTTPSATSG